MITKLALGLLGWSSQDSLFSLFANTAEQQWAILS